MLSLMMGEFMKKLTFAEISQDIINKDKYLSLKNDYHHGLTRYIHSIRVAKYTYKITKLLHLNYINATRGALLHDYFNEAEYLDKRWLDKPRIHPFLSLNNASKEYNLTMMEQNIIMTHMFPIGGIKPLYLESWVVTIVDKSVATYEYFNFKFKDKFTLWIVFVINFLSIKL